MGDINKGLNKFKLNRSEELKKALLEDLKNNKKTKQVIQLNGKSSLVFANLAALTLASCGGGGGGGGSEPATPTLSFSSQSFTFNEDTPGTFSISSPSNASGTLTITVDSIPSGLTLTTSDGTLLAAGTELTVSQLSNISFASDENANSDLNSFGNLVLTASDGSSSSTANISFTVTAIDDVPSLVANSFSFTEDTAASFDVSVVEVDGDTLTITVDAVPESGSLTLADGTAVAVGDTLTSANLEGIVYTPAADANSDITTIGDFVLSISDGTTSEANSISLIVSAVNDAPVLGVIDAVDVLETVAADATILTLTGSDVDGDTLTYSLTGDDADLFNVDSSGNVSFKASPNFKSPGDVGLDNTYNLTLTVTDAAGVTASSALAINILDVKPGGQAIDGYLVGATVWVDLDGDGIKDDDEPETTTDKTGAFEFEDDIPANTDIYVEGGYDLGTGKPNEQKFKLTTSITGDGTEALVISPVSTQISRAYSKSGVTLAEAQEKVAKAYGLDDVFEDLTNFDPIALAYNSTSNEQAKAALTAQARNIMVSSLGEVSKKVSEYFASEIAPTTRSQISDIFKFGTEVLRYSTWDSNVDLQEQPRIVIELEGFEDLLASTSETFNDKIVEAILASEDLTKLFEMKADGTGQFDAVISEATDAIILEIRNLILSEMGFDPATNFTTFRSLDNYTGETVTFLGSTKTMGEWAVIMVDVLDSMAPDPYSGLVDFGPDGGVTDLTGKYFAQQIAKMARLMETMVGKPFSEITDDQIDQLVDMGLDYNRANTFDQSYTRWVPFDEYGQELWSQNINFTYNWERFQYDSQGNRIEGNTGQWQLTADQIKAYLKDPSIQLNDGNWGNEFNTYNWTVTSGDLGMYLALAEARTEAEMKALMDNLTPADGSIANFISILDASFVQGKKVFQSLVTSALDFTLDKFTKFVEKTIDYDNEEAYFTVESFGMPVTTFTEYTLSNGETVTLSKTTGRGWDLNQWSQSNLRVAESGDYTYEITGGADKDLFTINDQGTISFLNAAPETGQLTDADSNGEYLLVITITDTSDGFTQEVDFKISIPTWETPGQRQFAQDSYPNIETPVIEVNEHQLLRSYGYHDQETNTHVELYKGIPINITGLNVPEGGNVWFDFPWTDQNGSPIKDNQLFSIWYDEDDQQFYLNVSHGRESLDYENPQDANGDNIYELVGTIKVYGPNTEEVGTRVELVVVVNNIEDDPSDLFPEWWQDDSSEHWNFAENKAPVASINQIEVNGKSVDNVFVVGNYSQIDNGSGVNFNIEELVQNEGEEAALNRLLETKFASSVTSEITGGADADKFVIRDTEYGTQFFFAERPNFDSPGDADGDNIYEFELTKTTGETSVTKTVRIRINESEEGASEPPAPLQSALVLNITEQAENIGNNRGADRNIIGTEEDDNFVREDYGFKYIDGRAGNDVFDSFNSAYLTGGSGADIFRLSGQDMANPDTFGIRDNSQPYTEGAKEGINGYDQNRDGVLDLATELDWTWVPLISDFTPGEDKIALTVFNWTGTNVPQVKKSDITLEQGTGELANHTLIVMTGREAENRGFENGGIIGVLLDTNVSDVSLETDFEEAGTKYELILGNIAETLNASIVNLPVGEGGDEYPVMQLSNGEYLWFYIPYEEADNSAFFNNFAISSDGTIYAPRKDNLDFENPKDANKDNTYELLFVGQTFSDITLRKAEWGGIEVDWENSFSSGNIAFSGFVSVQDDVSDNVGKISIAEANFINDDGLNIEMVDLVFKQISAVQGSLMDIDFKAIAEEINFDFEFFASADARTQAEDWFEDYQANRFRDFGRELEETFERNLLSKFSTYTNADSLTNLTGTAENDTITGTDLKETIFGKKGNDTIQGGAGDDVIFGDQGDDILDGGAGSDALDGGSGNDTFIVGEGQDVMDGASGNDKFDFSAQKNLPEFVKGGSGDDTIILSGISSNGLEMDDGSDADSLPDYTGIDLNKIVSIKETWTYTDDAGNQVQEEGWRNRLESIENIDLRDSESQVNKEYNETKVETIGFRLASNKLTLEDSDGSIHSLYTSASSSVLSANLVGGSMIQSNLADLVSSDEGTGKSPILRFNLDSIPAAGAKGTSSVTLKLYDGTDNTQASGERLLETTLSVNWSSDGENVTVTLPPQSLVVNYLSSDGNALTRTWENAESDALTFSYDDNGQPGIDLAIIKFFSGQGAVEGMDLTGYITSGDYFFDVSFSNLEFLDENDDVFTSVAGGFKVATTPDVVAYVDDIATTESAESATITVNLSKAASSDVTINYSTTDGTATAGSDYTSSSGTLTIAAGQTSGAIVVPVISDDTAEGPENFIVTLSDASGATLGRTDSTVTINNETVFSDVLNITWDALQRMSWDNRTWTIRGDDTDTVRLLGHEYTYDSGGGSLKTQFEPFRFKGTTVKDGITYNKYELWDGLVLIESGVTVIYGRRELGKAVAGENNAPEFWYQWKTVYENSVAVFGAVDNEWDRDGDTITYSLQASGDYQLFDINSTTGEVTFKVAPNYEAPQSQSAVAYGTTEADFANVSSDQLRWLNQYTVTVIGDDGSGEANAITTNRLHIDVRNLPDYDGYDPTNKIPFFKDMWGSDAKFIDDASDQSIKIKGFDLDFDTLTWELLGVQNSNGRWGTVDGETGDAIGDAPLQLSSTGILTPKSTISYEDGITWYRVNVSITDGKSSAVTKEYWFNVEDSLADGSLTVNGAVMSGSHVISGATVWQDLDNDGVLDAGEPTATTNIYGDFNLTISKSSTDVPILAKGGFLNDSGLPNNAVLKINSNLKEVSDREWGSYSMSPTSSITLEMQNLDRSITDKDGALDISKALGYDTLWMEGDGNFYGKRFYDFKNHIQITSSMGEWEAFNLNNFTINNLLTTLGESYSKAAVQIVSDALEDINAAVSSTSNVTGYSAASLTDAQLTSIKAAGYQAMYEALAELISGKSSFDGLRLSENSPVKITDHEGDQNVVHTPSWQVENGTLTLNTAESELSKADLQSALNLEEGAKGLIIEVELGTLPATAQTIEFKGVLIDGTDSTVDTGERGIDIRFQVLIDPSQEVGSANYAYVPASSDITVIYTGEDGTSTSTTVEHSGNMITVTTNSLGVPVMSVDFNEVFSRGIPQTDLGTYFTTSTASNGSYYLELDFAGSSLSTASGESFTKVVAPFKVADTPKPVVYVNDVTISESRGWNQVQLTLSKPATETFTLKYSFEGGDATRNDDYWWWSDDSGYRSVTFVKGQSTAVINVDIRNDEEAEGNETFNISLLVDDDSTDKVTLASNQVVVTIEDDDSSSSQIDLSTLTTNVLTKLVTTLVAELTTLTGANTATLNSSSTTFTEILLSNESISDLSTYLTTEVNEDTALYTPIVAEVIGLVKEYVDAARGPSNIQTSVKIDGQAVAKDFTAINIGFANLDLSSFTSTASDALKSAIIDDIYTTDGFKYTGATSVENFVLSHQRTIDADAPAYVNQMFPTDLRPGHIQDDSISSRGTSGNDTVTFNTANEDVIYQGLAGNDTVTLSASGGHTVYGGLGNDLIKETTSDGYSDYYFGGPGDDKLAVYYAEQKKLIGGSGNDIFILDYVTGGAREFNDNFYNYYDDDQDGTIEWEEINNTALVISDFEQGVDKIGLRNGTGDWDGKTIVAIQGTGVLANHTLLFMGKSERGDDSTGYVWAIVWNTTATDMTSDDFVLVDASYNTSTLSGVTISNDSALASDATLQLTDDGSNEENGGSENAMIVSGLIDDSSSFSFDNINSPDPVVEVNDYSDLLSQTFSSHDEELEVVVIDELEEEEMLISIDIV